MKQGQEYGQGIEKRGAKSRKRFKQIGMGSFFGDLLYREVIAPDHLLVKLKELVPWERFTEQLVRY
jgi:hypothetical protein